MNYSHDSGPTSDRGIQRLKSFERLALEDAERSAYLDAAIRRPSPVGIATTPRAERRVCSECHSAGKHRRTCSQHVNVIAERCSCGHKLAHHRGIVCHGWTGHGRCRCSTGGKP